MRVSHISGPFALILALLCGSAIRPGEAAAQPAGPASRVLDFEELALGPLGAPFSTALTGGGGPVRWEVQSIADAPSGSKVLSEVSRDRTENRFPLAILDGFRARDVELSVRFKAVGGAVDRAAGLVVRFQDADNYYVVRANALEDNVRLYRVVRGTRRQFAGADVTVSPER